MSGYLPIPAHPAYSISALGQVRSERSGLILSHDMRGRVKIRSGKKYPSFFVGELLAMAGLMKKPNGTAGEPARQAGEMTANTDAERAEQAEKAAAEAERRALQAERAAKEAKSRARQAEKAAAESEKRVQRAESRAQATASGAENSAQPARKTAGESENSLILARRANGHLIALVGTLRRRITELENGSARPGAKRGRPAKAPAFDLPEDTRELDFGD